MTTLSGYKLASQLFLVGVLGCATGCSWLPSSEAQTQPPNGQAADGPVAVETAIAQTGSVETTLEYTGTTEPLQAVSLRAQAEGQLLSASVDTGDGIAIGQPLARLDGALLQAELNEAEAELAARQSEVAQARSQVSDAQTQVEQARVELQQAIADADRLQRLTDAGAISQQEAELAQTARSIAAQALRSAQEQVATQQQGVASAQRRVASQQAIVEQARQRLAYTTLTSPIDGVVLARAAEPGDLVQPGNEVFSLGDFSAVKVIVQVSELVLSEISLGQAVQVRLDAFPDTSLTGRVTRISPVADPTARLIPVEVTIPNANGQIGSGLLARVNFAAASQTVVVPQSALEIGENQTDSATATLFVAMGEAPEAQVQTRSVQVGDRANGQVEIRSGLEPGEAVVVRSGGPLSAGQVVRLSILSES
ncbi:efflux RND transporter periplasmic adaptor subunit [Almyronema epifaneia]|uniref:Efflux RND transporter periplasmic adaptor subunit n=1 Tax=Almyronema epifaneia S1 TaxID=2991925 RepID=A0ABW6IGL6_9CYAN